MKRLLELLEKEFVTFEELEEIAENEKVATVESNGISGLHYGYVWHTVTLEDGEEYSVYTR